MSEPRTSPCEVWATEEDLGDCSDLADPELVSDALLAASGILFELSGRKFSGGCEDTVRPLCRGCVYRPGRCAHDPDLIGLGSYPITDVLEVLIDGEALDPALYQIADNRWLQRLAGPDEQELPPWPRTQRLDLEPTEPGTFEVRFVHGRMPPRAGIDAAATLACELLKARGGSKDCQLPKRVTSITRQGVSMVILDPFAFLEKGKTGLYEVDLFLEAYNPGGHRRRAAVISPDVPRTVRRTGSPISGS